jgi:toxin-antitoxin system PIN domain toxin
VIIPDVNLLLYAVISGFPQHKRARAWWERSVNGPGLIGLTPPAVFGFLRVATNARILESPLPAADAVDYVNDWLAQPNVDLLVPTPDHLSVALGLLKDIGTALNLTTGVQLAAFAIVNRGEIHSNDTDFGRFPGLTVVNPLQ